MHGTRTFVYGGSAPRTPRPVSDDDIYLSINRYRFIVSTIWTSYKKKLSALWPYQKKLSTVWTSEKILLMLFSKVSALWPVDYLSCRRFGVIPENTEIRKWNDCSNRLSDSWNIWKENKNIYSLYINIRI